MSKLVISCAEILVAATLLPLGLVIGYYFTAFTAYDLHSNSLIENLKFWPFLAAVVTAVLMAIAMVFWKIHHNKYQFEHFHIIEVGMILMIIGGSIMIIMKNENPAKGLYFCFIAHGICYVPALTYINIRASNTALRNVNVSLAHIFYFVGIALAAVVGFGRIDVNGRISASDFILLTRHVGTMILCFSTVLLIIFICFEIFKSRHNIFTYDKSLDEGIEMEIFSGQIFNQKYFLPTENLPDAAFTRGKLIVKEVLFIGFAVLSKVTSLVYFFYPFYFYTVEFTAKNVNPSGVVQLVHWAGVTGLVLSIVLLIFLSLKCAFLIGTTIKLLWIIVATILFGTSYGTNVLIVIMWLLFLFNGFGYSYPDLFILDFTNLKYNELVLTTGYIIEMMTTSTIFHAFVTNVDAWTGKTNVDHNPVYNILYQCIIFGIIYLVLIIGAVVLIPRAHHTSLLESKNLSWVQFYNVEAFFRRD